MSVLEHPCFENTPSGRYGRIHLPVAPGCNIQCRYCDRRYDCVNESRPGVTSRILSPEEAAELAVRTHREHPEIKVAGIAGPGEPLFHDATFETFHRIRAAASDMILCVSTNGVLLMERLEEIAACKVQTLTVTLNTLDPKKIPLIYARTAGLDEEAFVRRQREGIALAVAKGMMVKINMVLVPGINEDQVEPIASFAREVGVDRMNLMPLIPQAEFRDIPRMKKEELEQWRKKAECYLPQMRHCRHCRADACGVL